MPDGIILAFKTPLVALVGTRLQAGPWTVAQRLLLLLVITYISLCV